MRTRNGPGLPPGQVLGSSIAVGAGTGLVIGLLAAGGPGIALGLALGAGAGVAVGSAINAIRGRRG